MFYTIPFPVRVRVGLARIKACLIDTSFLKVEEQMRSICDLEVGMQGQKVKPRFESLTFVGDEGLEPSTTPL